jgi:hypothetical protein
MIINRKKENDLMYIGGKITGIFGLADGKEI